MPRIWRTMTIMVVSASAVLAGCSSGSGSPEHTGTTTSPAPPPAAVNPLTGLRPSDHPVVAVKIEDTALGGPQGGIDKADIVYVEQVEGGLTRLLAVFNSTLPTLEPVRSVRPSDPELALQFGHIIFVASGGSRTGIAPLEASPLRAVINDRGAPGFSRDPSLRPGESARRSRAHRGAGQGPEGQGRRTRVVGQRRPGGHPTRCHGAHPSSSVRTHRCAD